MRVDIERHEELAKIYAHRNFITELAYYSQYPPNGYVGRKESEFIAWVCETAYRYIKEREK